MKECWTLPSLFKLGMLYRHLQVRLFDSGRVGGSNDVWLFSTNRGDLWSDRRWYGLCRSFKGFKNIPKRIFPCGWVGLSLSVSVQWRGLWHSTIPSSKPPLHCGLVGARLKATWARHLILGQGLQHQTLWQLGAATTGTRAKGTQGQVPFFHLSGWKETIRPNSRRRSGWTLFCLNVLPCIIQAILVEDTKCQDLMKSMMSKSFVIMSMAP